MKWLDLKSMLVIECSVCAVVSSDDNGGWVGGGRWEVYIGHV